MTQGDSKFVFDPPQRILLGPGPSEVPSRVLTAMARPTVGYLDASYTALLEELQRLLRMVFATQNEATFAVTGSGTAAMEAAIYNLMEPGDKAIVGVSGYFGDRMRQIFERSGAEVFVVSSEWGQPIDPSQFEAALKQHGDVAAVGLVHGETSTGVQQPIEDIAKMARASGALVLVDTVASLAGVEFQTDAWGVDAAYTGAQKCLSAPPGISPITFGPAAMKKIEQRKTPCPSWYLDALLNLTYWRRPHKYHHTGAINLGYALYEALAIIEEQGLAQRIEHTASTAAGMWAGLEAMGLKLLVAPEHRLPTLSTVCVPEGVDEARVRTELMQQHGIEIAGGLGALAGKTWRIGLMGASCQHRHVLLLLASLEIALRRQGYNCPQGAGVTTAARHFGQA